MALTLRHVARRQWFTPEPADSADPGVITVWDIDRQGKHHHRAQLKANGLRSPDSKHLISGGFSAIGELKILTAAARNSLLFTTIRRADAWRLP
jgi:hypothetical protein